jgi:protein-S-isoprenylcysteine O-methyltransferase Ste14
MVAISVFGIYFSIKDPALMERRKQAGPAAEQSMLQKIVATIAVTSLFAVFIVCGLDRRFGWSHMLPVVSWAGDALVMVSFFFYYLVFKVNSFGASNIRVEENQRVASTGPYALVRHPMYSVGVLFIAGISLGLGSWWALILLVIAIPILVIRILDEEKVLENELVGYKKYEQKVRYRLLPYLW